MFCLFCGIFIVLNVVGFWFGFEGGVGEVVVIVGGGVGLCVGGFCIFLGVFIFFGLFWFGRGCGCVVVGCCCIFGFGGSELRCLGCVVDGIFDCGCDDVLGLCFEWVEWFEWFDGVGFEGSLLDIWKWLLLVGIGWVLVGFCWGLLLYFMGLVLIFVCWKLLLWLVLFCVGCKFFIDCEFGIGFGLLVLILKVLLGWLVCGLGFGFRCCCKGRGWILFLGYGVVDLGCILSGVGWLLIG